MIFHGAFVRDIDRPDQPRWPALYLIMRYDGRVSLEDPREELADPRWPALPQLDLEDVLRRFRCEKATRKTFDVIVEVVRSWLLFQVESGALRYDPSLMIAPRLTYLLHHPLRPRGPYEERLRDMQYYSTST